MTSEQAPRITESPRAVFLRHAAEGGLAYQVAAASGAPVFFPRVAEPLTGDTELEWRISSGTGVVYAATTVRPRGGEPHNVSMIELDEGFRMMSTVVGVAPDDVAIGQRVQLVMRPIGDDGADLPCFEPVGGEQ
ncbi:Zn-ribbon domain-containing OB-fold protein [Microbacterium insulae]|uniref:Zn-ribbon domain-containing OB-fold protein n=1 Tax=Microbacterium insulae TaxID=483014 RepID=A0ABW3AIN7_9MICO